MGVQCTGDRREPYTAPGAGPKEGGTMHFRNRGSTVGLVVLGILALVVPPVAGDVHPAARAGEASSLVFVENAGQFAPDARFQVRAREGTWWLADGALWLTAIAPNGAIPGPVPSGPQATAARTGVHLNLTFPGANSEAQLEPFGPLDAQAAYLRGGDRASWQRGVALWQGVRYVDLYP